MSHSAEVLRGKMAGNPPVVYAADRVQSPVFDVELDRKAKKTCERISENIHIVSNEPSLACYRLQEHIRKSLPQMVEKRYEVNQVHKQLQGKCYDMEYSIAAVNSIKSSEQTFMNIQELMKNTMFTKQQLAYKESQQQQQVQQRSSERKTPISMYQRFSGSFDLHSSFLSGASTSNAALSSSASASGDLRTTAVLPTNRATPSPRRARAASVSSSPLHGNTKSANNTPKHIGNKINMLPEFGEKM